MGFGLDPMLTLTKLKYDLYKSECFFKSNVEHFGSPVSLLKHVVDLNL